MTHIPFILLLLTVAPQAAPASHGSSHGEHQAGKPHTTEAAPSTKASLETKGITGSVVFECDFGVANDRNYDGWPDGWTRRHGVGYHDFLKIGIAEDKSDAARGRALFFDMNGGAAEVDSPQIPITPSFSYVLEGECRLTDLMHDDARITLTFLNTKGNPLQTYNADISSQNSSREWRSFSLGPFIPNQQTTAASIALQVTPRGIKQDLRGQAAFRRLHLQRLPRMTVRTNSPLNIFTSTDDVELQCEIAGIPHSQSTLHFELRNHEGRSLATHDQPLTTGQDSIARAAWKPTLPDFGFYQVQVRWQGQKTEKINRHANLAVLRASRLPKTGEFGWTLPAGEEPLDSGKMAALLAFSGVHWAKYPVTFTEADSGAADRIAWFAEKLSLQGIEMVGVLDHPPARETDPIASILEDSEAWKPWVDPIMTRLSLKVRWWQLGGDQDISLVGYQRLAEKTQEVKSHMERFGQQVKLGAGWQWLSPPPSGEVPLAVQSYSSDPPLTPPELEAYLSGPTRPAGAPKRWVTLDPLAKSEYSLVARAHDLATRMLAAKVAGADAVFFPRPFATDSGLMQEDGTPGELFLPWHTTATAITGGEYFGQLPLPNGSTNYVFVRDGKAVMAVWNDKPSVETIYFGEDLRQIDLWGRETVPPAESDAAGHPQHRLSVGTLPTFVTGLNEAIARFKLAAQFESPHLESNFNREQTIFLRLKNFFPQGISGEVAIEAPAGWKRDAQGTRFRLGPGEEVRLPISVRLMAEASSGPQPLRLDFSLAADRNYQFNVQRTLQLGLADVAIEMTSRLREDGLLEVTQQVTNLTNKPLSFQCVLFSPGQRRETRQLLAAPNGQTPLLFLLEGGEALVGQKLILRAEELGGGRVLNYSLTAER